MSEQFENITLETPNDFNSFAHIIGEKLRNPNFTPARRQLFLKTLLEEIKPVCSFRCYEKIQKTLNQIAHQKDLDEKDERQKLKKMENRKDKKLVNAKETGRLNKFGVEEDSYSEQYSDEEEDYEGKYRK